MVFWQWKSCFVQGCLEEFLPARLREDAEHGFAGTINNNPIITGWIAAE
jgi:hypothetical protein